MATIEEAFLNAVMDHEGHALDAGSYDPGRDGTLSRFMSERAALRRTGVTNLGDGPA